MGISDSTENNVMKLIFQAVAWANYADDAGTSPEANIILALHTADPGDSGTMQTSEVAYTNYSRASVVRSAVGWTVTNNIVTPAANIDFAAGTGGSGTATHFSTGKSGGGAAPILLSGTVTPNIVCGNGVTPRLSTATQISID